MEEQTFLNEGGLVVTTTRVEISGQTFAVRNIGSVRLDDNGTPWAAIILVLFGVFMAMGTWFGFVVIVGALAYCWQRVMTRKLVLVTGGGEVKALESTDRQRMERLRSAIAQAISVR